MKTTYSLLLFFNLLFMLLLNLLQAFCNSILFYFISYPYIYVRILTGFNFLLILLNIILIFAHFKYHQEHPRKLLFSINVLLSLITLALSIVLLQFSSF